MTTTRSVFGSATWMRCVAGDSGIPAGSAVAVALAIGAKAIRWPVWGCQVPVQAIAERIGVTPEYVRDVVQLLLFLAYLEDTGETFKRRPVYRPSLPTKFRNDRGYRDYDRDEMTNGDTDDEIAA